MVNFFYKLKSLLNKYWWLTPLLFFLLWRISIEIVARLANFYLTPPINPWPWEQQAPLLARWDSGWYASIVDHSYWFKTDAMSNVTFFPLYPLLWKITKLVTNLRSLLAGVVIANAMALLFSLVFWRWLDQKYSRLTANYSLITLLAFPTSFFMVSAYSESTLLLLSALTF
ncbi:MAG: hypothetical protein WC621_02900 [Patescibacteria group bacterium]